MKIAYNDNNELKILIPAIQNIDIKIIADKDEIFIENKYYKIYKKLISKKTDFKGYTEKHHIIPRCMGGNNTKENIVVLTAREHYIAHLLLTKCVINKFIGKINSAFVMMANVKDKNQERFYKINSKLYESRKILSIEHKKSYKHTEEAKKNISKNSKGIKKKPFTEEHIKSLSNSHKNRVPWNKGKKGLQKWSEIQKKERANKVVVYDIIENVIKCIDKENYYAFKNNYLHVSSKKYKLNYKGLQL